jgi:hypothetical protein
VPPGSRRASSITRPKRSCSSVRASRMSATSVSRSVRSVVIAYASAAGAASGVTSTAAEALDFEARPLRERCARCRPCGRMPALMDARRSPLRSLRAPTLWVRAAGVQADTRRHRTRAGCRPAGHLRAHRHDR